MSIDVAGRYAEKEAREFLKRHGFYIFQADWISQGADGKYLLWEVKHKEPFTPPPFWGHGLELYQIQARLNFQMATGIIAWLLILDKISKIWYFQRLDVLERGEYIDTHGDGSPIRIYNINSFLKEA